jgi:predicted  nucleic acid-binding Zn-ribbon protein
MAMNSETPKHGGSGGDELEKRVTDVETRLTVIEKTMVSAEVFQRELGAFRDEMRIAFDRMRDEMRGLRDGLRDEMHAGFDELRKVDNALRDQIGDVRKELQARDAALRDEMHVGFGELRNDIQALNGALRVEIAKVPFETFKWLLAAAGLAAAVAAAIYNIWFR